MYICIYVCVCIYVYIYACCGSLFKYTAQSRCLKSLKETVDRNRAKNLFTLSHIQTYSKLCVTLTYTTIPYSEPLYI